MNIEALKERRKELKITYDELSAKSGVPVRTIYGIFTGTTKNPRIDTVQAIEKALGLDAPSDDLQWTDEERALGVTDAIKVSITPDEDDILYLYRELIKKKGAPAHRVLLTILEAMINN